MSIHLICPGIHDLKLTDSFIQELTKQSIDLENLLVFPTDQYPPYSGWHILKFLQEKCQAKSSSQLIIIGFSAGVVGAISAAWGWQISGGKIKALIAFDGWGVPLAGNFPIYRVSHDEFTHWSSELLGKGDKSFYADPPVEHLELWRSPQQITGWMVERTIEGKDSYCHYSLRDFLSSLLCY
ncbi:MAG TPA: hypothetical protein DCF68_13320 [Cyanothece sp. UBA12306]|nr:hypothetical protein [Cyanothece sp. UBA12306]